MSSAAHQWKYNKFVAVCVLTLLGMMSQARAQGVWTIITTGTQQDTHGHAEQFTDAPVWFTCPINDMCQSDHSINMMEPDLFKKDFVGRSFAACVLQVFMCPVRGAGITQVEVDGAGSETLVIGWDLISRSSNNCKQCPGFSPDPDGDTIVEYEADGEANLTADIALVILGFPDGTPVDVEFEWTQFTFNNYKPECPNGEPICPGTPGLDDPAEASGELFIDGAPQFNGQFNLINTRGRLLDTRQGSFTAIAGIPFSINIEAFGMAHVQEPGRGAFAEDSAQVAFQGELFLFLGGAQFCTDALLEFSLDIGSDTELSDPQADGDEIFDPGDAYEWMSGPLGGPANGTRDDADAFFFDYGPDPLVAGTEAPTCQQLPVDAITHEYFDMDGHESVDFNPSVFLNPLAPLPAPILRFPSACVFTPDYLALSFDDDGPGHYTGNNMTCDVPVDSPSPFPSLEPYGSTNGQDEIVGATMILNGPTYILGIEFPIGQEDAIHTDLAPNPDGGIEVEDDDVDSLDAYADAAVCNTWLFSPDHEATGVGINGDPLDPGGIYQVFPASGASKIIDEAIHLGISEEADIDAFEFAWVCDEDLEDEVLVLLFSVDDDDPLTSEDESGGLDPRIIYASQLTGSSGALAPQPLSGDIDAIAVWCRPFTTLAPPCPADLSGDGVVEAFDLGILLGAWGPCPAPCDPGDPLNTCPADLSGDCVVEAFDLGILLGSWGLCN